MVSTGQGLLGNNTFAYCNNNPVNKSDPNGKDPITAAAIGGAVAGGVLSLTFYLGSAGDSATFGEALLYTSLGALAGALGGAAGMATGDFKIACVVGAGIISGISSDLSGGSFWTSFICGMAGTYAGTLLDISMFSGFDLGAASYLSSTGIGFLTEMTSQTIHKAVPEEYYDHSLGENPKKQSSTPSPPDISTRNLTYVEIY